MIELRPADAADLPGIVGLLRNANDVPYDLPAVAEEKCFGAGVAGSPRTLLATFDRTLAGVAVTCGRSVRLLAVHSDLRRQGIGSILLREAEKQVLAAGETVANLGAEAGNYFIPGIRADDEGVRRFFHLNGYERMAEEPVDLRVRLMDNPLIETGTGHAVRRARTDEQDRVLSFVEARFGAAWRLEASRAFEHEKPTLFIAERDGEIVGFSAHDANNRGLGFFGPAGVAEGMRGHGLGRHLLLASLGDLRRMGFSETIIPWAAAPEFYGRICGAEPAYLYLRLRKRLEA